MLTRTDSIDYALTAIACFLYVVSTYHEEDSALETPLWLAEIVVSAALLIIYVVRLQAAHHPLEHARTPGALLDLLTTAPVLVALIFMPQEAVKDVRILRVLRVLRTFTLAAELSLQPVYQQAVVIALTIVSVIYISMCSFPLLENLDNPHECMRSDAQSHASHVSTDFPLHDSLYFVIITITTVGYGDITPTTTLARMYALLMVTTTFVLLPLQTSKLIELLTTRDVFASTFRPSPRQPHILIFGHASLHSITLFREHLLVSGSSSSAQSSSKRPIRAGALVVVSPAPPDVQVQQLLAQQGSPRWLTWLVGSALSTSDLARAAADQAVAAYVIGDDRVFERAVGHSSSGAAHTASEAVDTRAVLDALSLRYRQPQLRCIVQLTKHTQARQLRLLGIHCVVECAPLMQLLLAVSSSCHGASTLLHHLVRPVPSRQLAMSTMADEGLANGSESAGEGRRLAKLLDLSTHRLSQQPVPSELVGMLPLDALLLVYSSTGSVLLARCPAAQGDCEPDDAMLGSSTVRGEIPFARMSAVAHAALSPGGSQLPLVPLLASQERLRADETLFCICDASKLLIHREAISTARNGPEMPSRGAYQRLDDAQSSSDGNEGHASAFFARRFGKGVSPPSISTLQETDSDAVAAAMAAESCEKEASWEALRSWFRGITRAGSTMSLLPDLSSPAGVRVPNSRLHVTSSDDKEPERFRAPASPQENSMQSPDPAAGSPPPPPAGGLRSHIVLCGLPDYPGSLWDFVAPLRSRARFADAADCPPILLLQPFPPSDHSARRALTLPGLYYLSGSCGSMDDLMRAGVAYASCVVIATATTVTNGGSSAGFEDQQVSQGVSGMRGRGPQGSTSYALYEDATALLTCRELDLWPGLRPMVVCQLRHASNIDFLRPPPPRNVQISHIELVRRTSSEDEDSSSLSIPLIDRMLSVLCDELQAPHHRAGRVLSPSFMRSVVCRLLDAPQLPALLQLMLLGSESGQCLQSWPIPRELHGKTYGELFEHLVRRFAAVPFGLLHSAAHNIKQVLTAPPAYLRVAEADRVYVLTASAIR